MYFVKETAIRVCLKDSFLLSWEFYIKELVTKILWKEQLSGFITGEVMYVSIFLSQSKFASSWNKRLLKLTHFTRYLVIQSDSIIKGTVIYIALKEHFWKK